MATACRRFFPILVNPAVIRLAAVLLLSALAGGCAGGSGVPLTPAERAAAREVIGSHFARAGRLRWTWPQLRREVGFCGWVASPNGPPRQFFIVGVRRRGRFQVDESQLGGADPVSTDMVSDICASWGYSRAAPSG